MKATRERPERVTTVDKIEEKRKPEDFIGHRNRNRPSGGRFGENCDPQRNQKNAQDKSRRPLIYNIDTNRPIPLGNT